MHVVRGIGPARDDGCRERDDGIARRVAAEHALEREVGLASVGDAREDAHHVHVAHGVRLGSVVEQPPAREEDHVIAFGRGEPEADAVEGCCVRDGGALGARAFEVDAGPRRRDADHGPVEDHEILLDVHGLCGANQQLARHHPRTERDIARWARRVRWKAAVRIRRRQLHRDAEPIERRSLDEEDGRFGVGRARTERARNDAELGPPEREDRVGVRGRGHDHDDEAGHGGERRAPGRPRLARAVETGTHGASLRERRRFRQASPRVARRITMSSRRGAARATP